jgi:hypothetical protein
LGNGRGELSFDGLIGFSFSFIFVYSCDMHFFNFAFLSMGKINFRLYMSFFLLVIGAKEALMQMHECNGPG